jgi:hypothetical protein
MKIRAHIPLSMPTLSAARSPGQRLSDSAVSHEGRRACRAALSVVVTVLSMALAPADVAQGAAPAVVPETETLQRAFINSQRPGQFENLCGFQFRPKRRRLLNMRCWSCSSRWFLSFWESLHWSWSFAHPPRSMSWPWRWNIVDLGCWGLAEPSRLAFGCFADSGIIETRA